ncbi:MAG: hypothetical protein R3C27_05020 [Hyphomonadaceae bacterium]
MLSKIAVFVAASALVVANAYATAPPVEEERGFPLTIVLALIAAACAIGTALYAASQEKGISG